MKTYENKRWILTVLKWGNKTDLCTFNFQSRGLAEVAYFKSYVDGIQKEEDILLGMHTAKD